MHGTKAPSGRVEINQNGKQNKIGIYETYRITFHIFSSNFQGYSINRLTIHSIENMYVESVNYLRLTAIRIENPHCIISAIDPRHGEDHTVSTNPKVPIT